MYDESHLMKNPCHQFSALISHWIGFAKLKSMLNAHGDLS